MSSKENCGVGSCVGNPNLRTVYLTKNCCKPKHHWLICRHFFLLMGEKNPVENIIPKLHYSYKALKCIHKEVGSNFLLIIH